MNEQNTLKSEVLSRYGDETWTAEQLRDRLAIDCEFAAYDLYGAYTAARTELARLTAQVTELKDEIEGLTEQADINGSFYRLTVQQRDAAWREIEQHVATIVRLNAQITELQAANTREVERRREAEAKVTEWVSHPLIDEIILLCDYCGKRSPLPCTKHIALFESARVKGGAE
jgi:cell division protein FtsB